MHQQRIAHWDPAGADLPDDTALHLDGCPDCQAVFDARFVPAGEAVATSAKTPWWPVMAAAAVALMLLGAPASEAPADGVVAADEAVCLYEPYLDEICEEVG